jgi:hypothetical protein
VAGAKASVWGAGCVIQDHFGRTLREVTQEEARTLTTRSQISPEDVADAARAACGVGERLDRYDAYIPDEARTVAHVIAASVGDHRYAR